MKIEGLPFDSGGIRNITEKKLPKTVPSQAPKDIDTVTISGNTAPEGLGEFAMDVPEDFPVRENVIEAVRERLSRDTYNTPEIQGKTAEKLVEFQALSTVIGMQSEPSDTSEQSERVESAQTRAASGYYDRTEALAAVAERLTEALGLKSLLGR